MSTTDYMIENCTAADFEFACPKKWSELKPSLMAAVRHCHHCKRRVYLCTTDADLKLYTSLKYCIAVIKPPTQAEKDREVRTTIQQPVSHQMGNQDVEREVLMGIPTRGSGPGKARPAPPVRAVPRDPDSYEVPTSQRMPLPDRDKPN